MTQIGIMSFAHMHANSYAACVHSLPNAELAAIWDDDPTRGRAAARQFDTRFVASVDHFLNDNLDAVIVCSENIRHRHMVEQAAEAGKWILCEKPLATTISDAKAIISACKNAKVGLGTAFPCRYSTPLLEMKKRVDEGALGKLLSAACTNNGQFPGGWFADPALSGGGAVMDHTVHVADALRWITGSEFATVYCSMDNRFHPEIKTDDVGSLHLEMESGLIVSHVASWNRPASFPTWGDVTIELIGERASLYVDAFNQKVDVYSDVASAAEWAPWGDNPDRALIADFIVAVETRRDPPVSGLDGLRALEVTLAAHRSARSGRVTIV